MKFHIGLAAIMITAILGGLLFLVLDDSFFCIKRNETDEAESLKLQQIVSPSITESKANTITEEAELLFKQKEQFTEKEANRDLLIRMSAIVRPASASSNRNRFTGGERRNTVNSLNMRNP